MRTPLIGWERKTKINWQASQVCTLLLHTGSDPLTICADLARALLERVIQGPELDLIWATYQDDGDENETAMDVDDEEAEAQKVA